MITSEQFSNLFLRDEQKDTRVNFADLGVVGFSITKEYPKTGLIFQPMRNQKNEVDSVALIKIYFVLENVDKNDMCPLSVWISPASKYLLGGRIRYNYEDQDSPSEEALLEWQKALKPPELLEDAYIFNTKTNKILNSTNNAEVNTHEIIEKIFLEHLKTAKRFRGLPFRLKLNTRDFFANYPLLICKGIYIVNKQVFSRDIPDTRSYDTVAYELFLKPIPHGLFQIKQPKDLKIFGTELPISKNSVIYTAFIFVSLNLIGYFWFPSLDKGMAYLFAKNTFLTASVVIIWFIVFDNWLPHILLSVSNLIVKLADWSRRKKIKV
ncbi:MAG: hypothetical protein Q7S11_01660 [bacterium]|nr:hypothetical protein [bacterium]